ncbi:UNVERIFIED_ORG: hypothetical protein GGI57_006063 [Rhizobium aethiopicum]
MASSQNRIIPSGGRRPPQVIRAELRGRLAVVAQAWTGTSKDILECPRLMTGCLADAARISLRTTDSFPANRMGCKSEDCGTLVPKAISRTAVGLIFQPVFTSTAFDSVQKIPLDNFDDDYH